MHIGMLLYCAAHGQACVQQIHHVHANVTYAENRNTDGMG